MDAMVPINEQLFREVEIVAARTGKSAPLVVEEVLRDGLKRLESRETPASTWPALDLGPLQPGVDLDNSAALLDLLEEGDAPL